MDDKTNTRWEFIQGEYRILVRERHWWTGARPNFQASDYTISVDVRNVDNRTGSYGIAFGIAPDWSSLYSLEIFPHGWYAIYRREPNNVVVTLASEFTPAINQGSATNHLQVERKGASITAYANGQLLASVTDSTFTGPLYLGLSLVSYNQPDLDIRFDNFTVFKAGCAVPNTGLNLTSAEQRSGQAFPMR